MRYHTVETEIDLTDFLDDFFVEFSDDIEEWAIENGWLPPGTLEGVGDDASIQALHMQAGHETLYYQNCREEGCRNI